MWGNYPLGQFLCFYSLILSFKKIVEIRNSSLLSEMLSSHSCLDPPVNQNMESRVKGLTGKICLLCQ